MAIGRLSAFPVPLPAPIWEALTALRPAARRQIIKSLVGTTRSPIAAAHLLALLIRFQDDAPAYARLARRMIARSMTDDWAIAFDAFRAVLAWVNDVFGYWSDTQSWSPTIRLALTWAHSERIFAICTGAGIPPTWLQQTLRHSPLVPELFAQIPEYSIDVAHPQHVEWLQFLIGALMYGLGEHASEWIEQGFGDRLTAMAFHDVREFTIPVAALLRDMSLAPDQLGVFFSGLPLGRLRIMCEELPIEQARQLWPLLIRLRTN